jgi:CspA family cold shock protein
MSERKTGTVLWFNFNAGYGFIKPDDGSPDVFVHISEVERALNRDGLDKDEHLEFAIGVNHRNNKPIAIDLRELEA